MAAPVLMVGRFRPVELAHPGPGPVQPAARASAAPTIAIRNADIRDDQRAAIGAAGQQIMSRLGPAEGHRHLCRRRQAQDLAAVAGKPARHIDRQAIQPAAGDRRDRIAAPCRTSGRSRPAPNRASMTRSDSLSRSGDSGRTGAGQSAAGQRRIALKPLAAAEQGQANPQTRFAQAPCGDKPVAAIVARARTGPARRGRASVRQRALRPPLFPPAPSDARPPCRRQSPRHRPRASRSTLSSA